MSGIAILLAAVAVLAGVTWWHASRKSRRRRAWRATRLGGGRAAVVERLFPLWKRVPEATRRSAEGWMRVFLEEKSFEPCGGLEAVTEEMMLAIAAPACLLIAHRPQDYYESLRSVLVYPDAYRVRDEWGLEDVRLGESWGSGSVVLAWQSVLQGDANPEDGLNVVLHEFAHQLDQEDGAADGVPEFEEMEDYGRWSRAMAPAYESFVERVNAGKRTVLDDYGAESPAEFFAVATETFFEKSAALKREEPEVYAELARFYGMDPAAW
ncbi:zinc-dependent peptidase [Haloferula sargassicola]|uniref:Protein MtfA n=1 Tax=Haloferula sargassicola TaxID=490096 RepID=A0ABP9US24_9BACT